MERDSQRRVTLQGRARGLHNVFAQPPFEHPGIARAERFDECFGRQNRPQLGVRHNKLPHRVVAPVLVKFANDVEKAAACRKAQAQSARMPPGLIAIGDVPEMLAQGGRYIAGGLISEKPFQNGHRQPRRPRAASRVAQPCKHRAAGVRPRRQQVFDQLVGPPGRQL